MNDGGRGRAQRWRAGVGLGLLNAPGRIGLLYGGTDKVWHGYMTYYRQHLRRRRLKRNLLFEVGVGGVPRRDDRAGYTHPQPGGSLALWRDYLPRSTIVGIDLHPKDVQLGPSVHFMQADQSDPLALRAVLARFPQPDIVIDDGSHMAGHIPTTFEVFWPALRPGGLYVVEDLSTSYYPSYGGAATPPPDSGVGLAQGLVDDAQEQDRTFREWADMGTRPAPRHRQVQAVHAYPGIVFIEKA